MKSPKPALHNGGGPTRLQSARLVAAVVGSLAAVSHVEWFTMKRRIFILASTAAGVAAFFIFRSFTQPLETALVWLLLLAFSGSSLLCSAMFSLLCQHLRWRWLRLVSVPLFLAAFTLLSGLGVFGVTRLVFDSRPRSADDGGVLYAATSGMQMLSLDHDLWYHVSFAVALPLLLLSALSAIVAFTGLYEPQTRQNATMR